MVKLEMDLLGKHFVSLFNSEFAKKWKPYLVSVGQIRSESRWHITAQIMRYWLTSYINVEKL